MPVTVKRKGGKFRVVEAATGRISMTSKGNPRDGGGHATRTAASGQARAINAAKER